MSDSAPFDPEWEHTKAYELLTDAYDPGGWCRFDGYGLFTLRLATEENLWAVFDGDKHIETLNLSAFRSESQIKRTLEYLSSDAEGEEPEMRWFQ